MTRVLLLTVLIIGLLAPASLASASESTDGAFSSEEQAFVDAINAERAAQGLSALTVNAELRDISRGWTTTMGDNQSLSHNPSYAEQYTGDRQRMGENVGYTSWRGSAEATVARLHGAFMNSSGHRGNILGDYNQVAVGVAYDAQHKMWVTVNFLLGSVPEYQSEQRPRHFSRGI